MIFKVYSQEVKTERNMNCSRALRRCIKICDWKYSANEMIRINNWSNQRKGFQEFSSGN
jgi:hypothetical protein